MVTETLARIEKTVADAANLESEKRAELLKLVGELRTEVTALAETHDDHARSIAGFAQMSTHEATRAETDANLLHLSLAGLAAAVRDFEATHPRLTATVNAIRQQLTNIGLG